MNTPPDFRRPDPTMCREGAGWAWWAVVAGVGIGLAIVEGARHPAGALGIALTLVTAIRAAVAVAAAGWCGRRKRVAGSSMAHDAVAPVAPSAPDPENPPAPSSRASGFPRLPRVLGLPGSAMSLRTTRQYTVFDLNLELRAVCTLVSTVTPHPVVSLYLAREVLSGAGVTERELGVIPEVGDEEEDHPRTRGCIGPVVVIPFHGHRQGTRAQLWRVVMAAASRAASSTHEVSLHLSVRSTGNAGLVSVACGSLGESPTVLCLGGGPCVSSPTTADESLLSTLVPPSACSAVCGIAAHILPGSLLPMASMPTAVTGAVIISSSPADRAALRQLLLQAGLADSEVWVFGGAGPVVQGSLDAARQLLQHATHLLMFVDIVLDDGDGHEVCSRLRALRCSAHVVALLPGPRATVSDRALTHLALVGFDSLLERPFQGPHVQSIVAHQQTLTQPRVSNNAMRAHAPRHHTSFHLHGA